MKNLTSQLGTALLIITHNLGIIARYADRLNVMYAGKIRESGTAEQVYLNPAHPYTIGLLNSVPRLDRPATDRLDPIPGEIPDPSDLPTGCAFRPRCRWATTQCEVDEPPLEATGVQNGRTDAQPANAPALVACFEANAVATSIEMART